MRYLHTLRYRLHTSSRRFTTQWLVCGDWSGTGAGFAMVPLNQRVVFQASWVPSEGGYRDPTEHSQLNSLMQGRLLLLYYFTRFDDLTDFFLKGRVWVYEAVGCVSNFAGQFRSAWHSAKKHVLPLNLMSGR